MAIDFLRVDAINGLPYTPSYSIFTYLEELNFFNGDDAITIID